MKQCLPISHDKTEKPSRRDVLKLAPAAAGAALAGLSIPCVHAAEENGAVGNAFNAPGGPVKLVAMADIVERKLAASHASLSKLDPGKVDVPPERRFVGFDAYKKAIDCLRPGDVALLTTRAAFRPLHLEYAVQKGVNVFFEKSFATDPVGVRRVLKAAEESEKKGLKIAAGTMCRHSRNRQELIKRIRDGEMGQIQLLRAYRTEHFGGLGRKPEGENEIFWQLRSIFHLFWVSAGLWSEADIHQIDEMCWIKDAWPVSAHGIGGRAANSTDFGQNLDSCAAEWTFADGTKAYYVMRNLPNCHNEFATYIHGAKCGAQFSGKIHAATTRLYKDQRFAADNVAWEAPPEEISPWQAEWNVFLDAIRNDRRHNEARQAAMSQLADIMGRAAIHMGRVITFDEVMASSFEWVPGGLDNFNENSPPPVVADAEGHYPVPVPGQWVEV
ncbi:MAG: twin-arginine translocation signal domain-containing protein [Pirellulales bacterium]|nr:twin-arginine translocation signal domain-containing protein [Pirellulales bacterium]